MNIVRKIKSVLSAGVFLLLVSCNSWLQVEPEDKIMDKSLFKDKDGFMIALNGVYSEMNRPALYGRNLTMGMIDVMAQYYNCSVSNHDYSLYMNYSYGEADYKSKFEEIWTNLYAMIANCNVIIEHCGDGNPVLSDVYYRMIKGESLALRAMMHFDLLRMFGPIWSEKEMVCIPYMTNPDRAIQPLLRADSVMHRIIGDLEMASSLLEPVDPVITEGAKNYDAEFGSNDMNYRQYRLNYFAVNALLARAYLWSDNKQKAGEYARTVIEKVTDESKPLFPLVEARYMQSYSSDGVFSPELLFSLYNTSRYNVVYKAFFDPSLDVRILFSMAGNATTGRVSKTYDDENDYRYKMWRSTVVDNQEMMYLTKFEVSSELLSYSYMLPLIRMSELYLIAAECEENVQVALDKYLNPLRFSRNCVNLSASSPEELEKLIGDEFLKEFIGEGQLFFYYKRKALRNIPNGATVDNMKNMDLESYVFPLPDSETSQRVK